MPEALLDEVTALVEWPVVYECKFEDEFLSVPQECLILTMQTNQKYFALTDANGKLRSRFLIVSNLETATPQHIIQGNERVVRPRLSDAKFFFEQDKKKTLAERVPLLAKCGVPQQARQPVATYRTGQDAGGGNCGMLGGDVVLAERGALLAKTDLLTDMVGEFPELQGIMGTYYARHDGEADEVALAASEHYQPRFAGDALPASATGTAVALADKLETLVGIWGIGLQPTGDKDPFALRRHALGILRMLIEKRLPLSISALLKATADLFAGNPEFKDPSRDVTAFLHDRLRGQLRERGYAQNEIEAVVAQQPDTLDNITERLDAVQAFAALPEAEALAAANKRITNILKKIEGGVSGTVQNGLLREAAEQGLYSAMLLLKPQVDAAYAAGDFSSALKALAQLRQNVDAFFADVMVNAEDEQLRNNRQAFSLVAQPLARPAKSCSMALRSTTMRLNFLPSWERAASVLCGRAPAFRRRSPSKIPVVQNLNREQLAAFRKEVEIHEVSPKRNSYKLMATYVIIFLEVKYIPVNKGRESCGAGTSGTHHIS